MPPDGRKHWQTRMDGRAWRVQAGSVSSYLVGHTAVHVDGFVVRVDGDRQVFERPLAFGHHQAPGDFGELRVVPVTIQDQRIVCWCSKKRIKESFRCCLLVIYGAPEWTWGINNLLTC